MNFFKKLEKFRFRIISLDCRWNNIFPIKSKYTSANSDSVFIPEAYRILEVIPKILVLEISFAIDNLVLHVWGLSMRDK
jgi:hypothetical protein